MTSNQTKLLFYTAALFNWGGGLILCLLAPWLGLVPPQDTMNGQIALVAIFMFGIGYWMVGSNPRLNRGIVTVGAWAKLGVVAVVMANWLAGNATPQAAALFSGDLLYAALFFVYLKRTPA